MNIRVARWIVALLCSVVFGACSEEETASQDAGSIAILPDFGTLGSDGLTGAADGSDGADGQDEPDGTDAGDAPDGTDETDSSEPNLCCATDADCPVERSACAPVTSPPIEGEDVSTKGMCHEPLTFPGCLRDGDCGQFGTCVGMLGCACDDFTCESTFGLCELNVPEECCEDFSDCGFGQLCVKNGTYGLCLSIAALKPGRCYNDETCPQGQLCLGAVNCDCAAEDCTPVQGVCVIPGLSECQTDDECNGGSCMATEPCTPDCAQGDASCCYGNQCIFQTSECSSDDECAMGPCIAGGTCYSWCPIGDPSCCFGNTCFEDPCVGENPQGCYFTGCGPDKVCQVDDDVCIPTQCECGSDGWICSSDCLGGTCVDSACVGKNPQGCFTTGCPEGYVCQQGAGCTPSACTCDEALGAWECSSDCGGGVCVQL